MVSILDFNKLANPPYYVMEYLPGGKLTQHAGRLARRQLLTVAAALADVLAAFHKRCGAHGDYKPDNILVTHDGELRLGDPAGNGFGFSVLLAPARGGTPGYWAPEIRGNGTVSVESDVFSFGASLSHLVTGQRPVDGQSLDPWEFGFGCSTGLRDVILRCTQTLPKARPTMTHVVRALRGESWESIQESQRRQEEKQRNVGLALAAGVPVAFLFSK